MLFDLDGVLNTYDGKYDKNNIPSIKEGARELIKEMSHDYKIVIFTTRNLLSASSWVIENKLEKYVENVTNVKEPAFLIIDDRCINFQGNYKKLKEQIENFEVWYKKQK